MSPSRNDIKFFGTLSAAMTHDMKNFLAIINENAGLLADLSANALKKAIPVDPLKAATISQKIEKQVARADDMIKRFNRFSHSMDHDAETVDMEEAVNLMAHLAERIFRQDRIRLTVTPAAAPCRIHASRFALLHLIFRALDMLCRNQIDGSSDFEKPVTVRFGSDPKIPEICFIRDSGPAQEKRNLFGSPEDQALLARVNMRIKPMDSGAGFCLYTIPPERR
jgi:signal transduction histidine kinase